MLCELAFSEAVTAAGPLLEMVPDAAAKLAMELPAGTTTDAGVVREGELLERTIVAPLDEAAWLRTTVQFEVALAPKNVGEHTTEETAGVPSVVPPPVASSTAPMEGGLGLMVPQTSVVCAAALAPAPITGLPAAGVKLKLAGEL